MKLRFSLRALLIAVTIAIAFCVWRDRPRRMAVAFANAVNAGDYEAADAMLADREEKLITQFLARDDRNRVSAERTKQSPSQWLRGETHVALSFADFGGLGGDMVIHMQATALGVSPGPVTTPAQGVQWNDIPEVERAYSR